MFNEKKDLNMSVFEYLFLIGYSIIITMGVFATSQFSYSDWWGRTYTIMIGLALLLMIIGFIFYSTISKRAFILCILLIVLCLLIRQGSDRGKEIMTFTAIVFLGGLIDWKKSIRVFFIIASCSVAIVLILYSTGVFYPEYIGRSGEDTVRLYLGFIYTAIPANFYFHIVLAYFFLKKGAINLLETIIVLVTNYLLFKYTDTNAVFYGILALVIILWIYRFFPQIFRLKYLKILSIVIVPALAVAVIALSYMYTPMSPTLTKLDKILNTRLALGHEAIEKYGIHLFGNNVTWSNYTGRYGENVYEEYFFVDSSYLNILITFGIIILIIICVGYALVGKKLFEKKHYMGCIIFILFAIHCGTDHHLFEVRYNPFLVLIGFVFINKGLILKRGISTMNSNFIKKEREISIRSLFARVFRKWWLILIVAAAVGVLAGGYKIFTTSKAKNSNPEDTMTYEEYQKKLADYEHNTKTLKDSIKASEDALQSKIDYLSNSILAKLDPNNVYVSKNNCFFESENPESALALRDRAANRAVDLYSTYVTSLDFWTDLSNEMETEPQYLLELVTTTPDYEASNLLVTIKYTDEEGAKKISDYMINRMQSYTPQANKEVGNFKLISSSPVVSKTVDTTLQNWHFNKTSEIKNLENSIKQLQQSLDKLSKPAQPATTSRSALAKEGVLFGIKAAAAGAGAMIILLSIIIVASKKVLSSKEFYDRYELKEVARFPKSGTGRSSMSDKERYDIAVENINKYSGNSDNILVVGKAPKAAINLAVAELRKRMGNISIDYIENVNDSTAHINRLKEADSVIITETVGSSRYNKIDDNIKYVYDWDKPIVGSILY